MNRKTVKLLKRLPKNILLSLISLICVFPLFWVIIAATNKSVDVLKGTLVPGTYLAENWKTLVTTYNIAPALINSVKYSVVTTLASLVVSSIAGYGFEVYHDRGKDSLFKVLMLTMMIPFTATMIPLYRMYSKMHLLDTTLGFILPSVSAVFLIMLFRQNSRAFPMEIIEAARIDGESELGIFFKMYVPTMRPTYAAGMTITFMNAWNNFMWAKLIMSNDRTQTFPMLISNMTSGHYTDYGELMLAVLISTLPTIIVFFALQKSFVQGMTGAVKG
ncbi:MAG: carbohydrate ABC transporter permease [Blautia sp.]|nr:carbohydrate ABC transporter permease [Lachnoclostridium sp.]MCM1212215.1 carbohydrate ABC transporter permease [Blautia sp.]